MIYTVTLNPSLDYVVRVKEFTPGNLHRTQAEDIFAGGKGINVSIVLKRLGVESTALGFIAGFTGKEIIHKLNEMGISSDFIEASQGISRINIKLKSQENVETEINGQGPVIDQKELEQFYLKLSELKPGDFLILSGSVPKSLPAAEDVYKEICNKVKTSDIRLVIDAEGNLLRNTLSRKPFLIKPNHQELEALFQRTLTDEQDILTCAQVLQKEGAANVLVSLGGDGALLVDQYGTVHRQTAPQEAVLNSVGAGDSLIAGFLAHLIRVQSSGGKVFQSEDYKNALKLGVAAGSAGAFSIGLPEKERIDQILRRILL